MSNVSPVDQLRVALNMTLSSHLEPLREALIAQSVASVPSLHEALRQLTRDDLESLSPQSVAWARSQFMQHDQLPFETWSALLLYQPERQRKPKPTAETGGGFSAWSKTHSDAKFIPEVKISDKSPVVWESFLLVEKVFATAPGNWLTKASTLHATRDMSSTMVVEILKQLQPRDLTDAERQRVCKVVINLPVLLFPPDALDHVFDTVSFGWLGALTLYAQKTKNPEVGQWELRSVQAALKKLDKHPSESLQLLGVVLKNFVTQPSDLRVRVPTNPKVFSHYKDVLEVVDTQLNWSEEDKLRFVPSGDDFLKIVRKRIVPNGNIAELVEDLFTYPMERLPNKDQIVKEFAQRFQAFMFFSVFANSKTDLDSMANAVQKVPAHILHAAKNTPAAPIDLKTVEAIIMPAGSSHKVGLKSTMVKILSSKKRKDERYVAVRKSIMQWLPSDLANSANLLLHWADPQQYDKPKNAVTSLAVNKRGKEFDSADVAELRSLFLKQNLLHELGSTEGTERMGRKM